MFDLAMISSLDQNATDQDVPEVRGSSQKCSTEMAAVADRSDH